ncbi:tetratricopeptide repeat protein [Streptomyces pinistramenti]|uniref:tetratricopeptide repeat protein n=1 Tax=Streptomyces pinistramenti TaxID=2884812 RepID=UPI001D074EC1|nr:tetratricopeptide repeat protein [Streptomyces pinistramenti]MCB5908037.1 tetratricopeptide repeat protein [Streptomyces pinistramenti]
MLDPTSTTAVMGLLGTVTMSMATEAGKRAWESIGVLARRVAGREMPAPAGAEARGELAALLADGARRNPEHARALATLFRTAPGQVSGEIAIPRQLPTTVRFFTDRQEPLKRLTREAARKADGLPRVALVYGQSGIGTSAVAVHWGSVNGHRFPDGQLYLDLRSGSGAGILDGPAVIRRFLRKLGVTDVPPAADDCADLYRSIVADRRLLVVLDHARSAAQIRPLLTSAPGVFTLVVARRPLSGLDAVPVPVGPLARKDALALLGRLTGTRRPSADEAVLQDVLSRCGGSPFALRSAATFLADPSHHPRQDGPDATGDRPARHQEPALRDDGNPVRAAADDLYRALPADAARLYRLMALWPWPAIGPAQAAAAGGITEAEAGPLLADLAACGLLETADSGRHHYRPLVRQHAEEAAARQDGPAGCSAAVARVVSWALRFAVRADRTVLPQRWQLGPRYTQPEPGPYANAGVALAAIDAELPTIVAAALAADEYGDPDSVWQLCEALWGVQLKAGRHEEVLPALRAGVRAAQALETESATGAAAPGGESGSAVGGSPLAARVVSRMHTQLALALQELGPDRYAEAETALRSAAEASQRAGHLLGRATALETLGLLRLRQWRHQEAYDLFDEADGLLVAIPDGGEGAADVPRARALLERHRGRALRGLGDRDAAAARLERALRYFRDTGEDYNTARALTDLAETRLEAGHPAEALPLFEEAAGLLAGEHADFHLIRLRELREGLAADPE